ncbi:MAG: helix-turn-helix domain-containing protein [Clostridium tyrobutyricum]|jgi:DNA-binding transcriptional regulator YhcF (GntR family)|uniref:helix-turn-helix domain-containing protein n=1 Tax=Clostridium tyrobutyricum TaxID=1519 RepID=UPI00073DB245|nr:helix-turn-helix domain-containing protein [Clostridium tyrobutyricum]MBV4420688.1 helix-turn-helix domain-containing protein [Clostridium tyrobutyricum]MCH4198713.1 helix-turn-helix domain-containing protein [Clostridium tyrobutyricum]MCH4238080.1 helix-turn-helix domain-containing protein [Clostridium tyrobutyricum]MCH4257450.1 helix-turn-helix domain-containing protein [Clostridium tyrobutyricum]MCI1238280.1 helix-turn-helix domain-containing protein [Clostridium tyrobutyricum]
MTYTSFYSASQKYVISNLSDNAFRIYHYLLSMCYGKKNTCFPSQATIAKATHRTIRTIQRGLKELEQKGIIKSRRRGSTSNLYTVLKKVQLQAKEVVSSATEKVENTIKKVKNSFYNNTL